MLKKKIENKQSRLRLAVIMLALVMTVTGCSDSSEEEPFDGDTSINGTWLGPNGEELYLYNGSFKMSFDDSSIISGEYETYRSGYGVYVEEHLNFLTKQVRGTIPREWFSFFWTSGTKRSLRDRHITYVLKMDTFTITYYQDFVYETITFTKQ